jgi:hypothetical protein
LGDVTQPYNPLDLRHLGESVARALLAQPLHPLPPDEIFEGSGIYSIYYLGDFPAYRPIAKRNRAGERVPVYVGKAIPTGRRRGRTGFDIVPGPALYRRLREHARTVEEAQNLEPRDFACQFLVVAPVWIPLAEEMLVRWFAPLWNGVIDGFGNHDPGSGRYNQQRSLWDVLHPGRVWAERCQPNARTLQEVEALVRQALAATRA